MRQAKMARITSLYYPQLNRRSQYTKGVKYTDYRMEICEDCQHRCAYCDAHESILGGYEAMQLEHYYPQSRFPERSNDPLNLLWVCNRCNLLKGADWHDIDYAEIHTTRVGYLDPFIVDRTHFFHVESNGDIKPVSGPADFVIKRLRLNRSFLIRARRSRKLVYEYAERVETYFSQLISEHQELLVQKVIDLAEFQKRVDREQTMKKMFLDVISAMEPT